MSAHVFGYRCSLRSGSFEVDCVLGGEPIGAQQMVAVKGEEGS